MAHSDGTIYIDTLIDTKGVSIGTRELQAGLTRATKKVKDMGETARVSFQKMTNSLLDKADAIGRQEAKIDSLRSKLKELSSQRVATDEFKEIQAQIDTSQHKMDRLKQANEDFLADGGDKGAASYQKRLRQIEELRQTIIQAKADQDDLLKSGGAYTAVDTSKVANELASAEARLEQMKRAFSASEDAFSVKADMMREKLEAVRQKEADAAAEASRLLEIGNSAEISDQRIVDLNNELVELKARQADLKAAGVGLGFAEYDQLSVRISEITQELKAYQASLSAAGSESEETETLIGPLQSTFMMLGNAIRNLPMAVATVAAKSLGGAFCASRSCVCRMEGSGCISKDSR